MAKPKKKYETVKVRKKSYDDVMKIIEYAVKRGIGNKLPAKVEKTLLSGQRGGPGNNRKRPRVVGQAAKVIFYKGDEFLSEVNLGEQT